MKEKEGLKYMHEDMPLSHEFYVWVSYTFITHDTSILTMKERWFMALIIQTDQGYLI